ncbi:MAG: hypothetical protein ABEJ73_03270 [Haloplanus sp.]
MIGYYDYVLGLVPFALVGLPGALVAAGVDFLTAVPVGATVASLVVGHALFVNGPIRRPADDSSVSSARGGSSVQSAADSPPLNAD